MRILAQKRIYPALTLVVAAVLLAADQIIKHFVLQYLRPLGTVQVIPGLLELTYTENDGIALGMLKGYTWLILVVTAAASVTVLVLLFRYRAHSFFSYTTAALLLGGGIGNLLDRIQYEFVVDYIHVLFFPYIFNFADCCVTIGAVCFVIHMLFCTPREDEKVAVSSEGEVSDASEASDKDV